MCTQNVGSRDFSDIKLLGSLELKYCIMITFEYFQCVNIHMRIQHLQIEVFITNYEILAKLRSAGNLSIS